jgi:translocation and assembly module TamB
MRLVAPKRSPKWLRRIAQISAIAFACVTLLASALLGALRLRPVRVFAIAQVNSALSGLFLGRLHIESVARIGLTGIGGVNATMFDVDRHAVLIVRNASAKVAVIPLLWSIVAHPRNPVAIALSRATADHAEVWLIDAGRGVPTLAVAFYPSYPSAKASGPAIPTIRIRSIAIGHAWVHGQLNSAPAIDAEIGNAAAQLDIEAPRLRLQIHGISVHVRGLPNGVTLIGSAGGVMDLPIVAQQQSNSTGARPAQRLGPIVHAWYNGQLAGSRIATTFDWINEKLTASIDSSRVESASVARIAPGVILPHPLMLHAIARGTPADVHIEARVSVEEAGNTALVIIGRAALGEDTEMDVEFRAKDVNLADLRANAPESRLDGVAHAQVTRTHRGTLTARYDLTTWPGLIAGTPIPALDLKGSLDYDAEVAVVTNGQVHILEPGADTTIQYSIGPAAKSKRSVVSIESFTQVAEPSRLRSLAHGLRAQGSIEVSAHYWPDDGHWRAQSNAKLHNVRLDQMSATRIDVLADVTRGRKAPTGSLHVLAHDIKTAGQTFRDLNLVLDGTLTRSSLAAHLERDDSQQLNLTSELGLEPTLRAYNAHIALPSDTGDINISIDDIRSSSGVTHIGGLHLQGAGTVDASLTIGRELEQLSLSTESFEWARVARLLGVSLPVQSANSTLVARYKSNNSGAEGIVRGHTGRIDFGPYRGADAEVNLALSRGLINGTFSSNLGQGSRLDISVQSLPLSRIEHPELVLASHDFSLSVRGAMNIAPLKSWAQTLGVPLGHVAGTILVELTAQGPTQGHESNEVMARVQTNSLQLAGLSDAQAPIKNAALAKGVQAWSIRGVDGNITLSVSGEHPIGLLSAELYDQHGVLFNVQASGELPPSVWRTLQLSKPEVLAMPVLATLHMPRRLLQQFPPIAGMQGLRGTASLDIALQGALNNPQFVIRGALERLVASVGHRPDQPLPALDVRVQANGSRYAGEVRAEAKEQNLTVGSLLTTWTGDTAQLVSASLDAPSPVQGEVVARFNRFDLKRLSTFRNYQMSGLLTGSIALRDWGHDARIVTQLFTEELQIGSVIVDRAELTANSADGQLVTKARLSGHNSGTLEAEFATKVSWGDRVAPIVDPALHGELKTKGLELGVVSPFLSGSVNELSGSVDANVVVSLDKEIQRVEGQALLSRGVIQFPSIGQRFDSIQARATVHDGTLRVENMQARGLTGRMTGSAKFLLAGLSLKEGDIHLAIAPHEQVPITVEGQAMGDASGRVDVKLNRLEGSNVTNIRVDVPELRFDLPDIDPRNLQTLELDQHVRIGVRESDGRFIFVPVQPLVSGAQSGGEALKVDVHLGRSVWVQKGPGVKVQLAGDLRASIAEKTTLEGRLDLRGGKLDVSGKTFEIERGIVTFDGGDTGNPTVNARARWDSPAGYSVYAEYAGTVNDGKLTLRSEPALSSDKVLTLLMFGTPDGAFGAGGSQSQGGETTSAAVGVAGGAAVKGLNKAITGVTKLDISARLDTSTGTARPELDVQLTPRVTARMTRAIGEPAADQSPDRTFLTLELRLLRAWSLSAVVGDHGGSGLDLLWRRRY